METFAVAATHVVAKPLSSVDLASVQAPSDEPQVRRWPGWARLAILFGGSTALWAGIAWAAVRVMKLS
ncbi:MAG TPA: hypothetical protein VGM25_03250 [Caulobacteraceae bacterium]